LAVFKGVRSLFINELDEKVFTTGVRCHFASGINEAWSAGLFAVVAMLDVHL
jgi:hypothetical protein